MRERYQGRAWVFGDNISNDVAVHFSMENKHLSEPKDLAPWCMINYEADFPQKAQPGDIIVAGKNFGCGHAHDHFPRSLKGVGIEVVVAESFSGDFTRMIANLGYPLCLVCPGISAKINSGDIIAVDPYGARLENITTNEAYNLEPLAEALRVRFEHGGTLGYLKWYFAEQNKSSTPAPEGSGDG